MQRSLHAITLAAQLAADRKAGRAVLFLLNKSDLVPAWQPAELFDGAPEENLLTLSANDADHRARLEKAIVKLLRLEDFDPDAALLANRRQLTCAREALTAVREALAARAAGLDLDAVGVCVQDALTALYSLTGENAADAVVDEVFSRFCVGK